MLDIQDLIRSMVHMAIEDWSFYHNIQSLPLITRGIYSTNLPLACMTSNSKMVLTGWPILTWYIVDNGVKQLRGQWWIKSACIQLLIYWLKLMYSYKCCVSPCYVLASVDRQSVTPPVNVFVLCATHLKPLNVVTGPKENLRVTGQMRMSDMFVRAFYRLFEFN